MFECIFNYRFDIIPRTGEKQTLYYKTKYYGKF